MSITLESSQQPSKFSLPDINTVSLRKSCARFSNLIEPHTRCRIFSTTNTKNLRTHSPELARFKESLQNKKLAAQQKREKDLENMRQKIQLLRENSRSKKELKKQELVQSRLKDAKVMKELILLSKIKKQRKDQEIMKEFRNKYENNKLQSTCIGRGYKVSQIMEKVNKECYRRIKTQMIELEYKRADELQGRLKLLEDKSSRLKTQFDHIQVRYPVG